MSKTTLTKQMVERPRSFDAEALGASLRQLAVDVVKGETTDFMSRWFRSMNSDADLVIWTDGEKRIIKHQLCFFGQVVEWNPINGTRTGLVIEEELQEAASALDGDDEFDGAAPAGEGNVSETIRFDESSQRSVVLQAIQLLSRVPDLNEADRSALIYNLKESPKLHKNARERALKAWAPKVDELNSTQRPTFWKRLRNWVLGE